MGLIASKRQGSLFPIVVFILVFLITFSIIVVAIKRDENQVIAERVFGGSNHNHIMLWGIVASIPGSVMAVKPINVIDVAENIKFLLPASEPLKDGVWNMGFDWDAEIFLADNKRFANGNSITSLPIVGTWWRDFVLANDDYAGIRLSYSGRRASKILYFEGDSTKDLFDLVSLDLVLFNLLNENRSWFSVRHFYVSALNGLRRVDLSFAGFFRINGELDRSSVQTISSNEQQKGKASKKDGPPSDEKLMIRFLFLVLSIYVSLIFASKSGDFFVDRVKSFRYFVFALLSGLSGLALFLSSAFPWSWGWWI